jgi:hypothetical protein
LHLGIYGAGDLEHLRRAFTFTRDQPIGGDIALGVLVEGPIDNPLIVADANGHHAGYRTLPFDGLHASVVYDNNVVALAPLHATYGGTSVAIRGALDIGRHLQSHVVLHVTGSAERLPYLDDMLGNEPMVVDAVANGSDFFFRVRGATASARGVSRVAAVVALDPNGTGSVEPFWLHTERGDFDGGYYLDRPHNTSGFWAIANGLQMHAPRYATFPGIVLPQLPPIKAKSFDAIAAGGGAGNNVSLAGLVTAKQTEIAGVYFDALGATFGGTLANAAVNRMSATGPWGSFAGDGAFSSQSFVARGTYRGTFEGLQPFLGNALPGHGSIAGNASIAVVPNAILVQGSHLVMQHATLRGIPVANADLTLAVETNRLRIYSAHATAADGDVVAAGTYSLAADPNGNGDKLSLIVRHLDATGLRGIGLPLDAGRITASGDLAAGLPLPAFDGAVSVLGGHLQQYRIEGSGEVHLRGDAAHFDRMLGKFGDTYMHIGGSIGSLSSGDPAYGLQTDVPAGSIVTAMHSLGYPTYMTEGSFNAQLDVSGRGANPTVAGQIGVPAGDVNGLPFINGSAAIAASGTGVNLQRGRVLFSTTAVQFAAVARPHQTEVHVDAPRADLSDFNNFFDTGDTLDGDGSVKLAAASVGSRFTSSGDVAIRAFRYRNLPIGDTRAVWSSARDVVTGSVAVGGSEGLLRAHGSVGIVPSKELLSMLLQSHYDVAGDVSNLDLSLWIPALGFQNIPLTGRASGNLSVNGTYPLVDLRGSAHIDDGSIGPLTLERAQATIHSSGSRILVDSAQLTTPGLQASANGSFGLRSTQPIDLQIHATTDQLPLLTHQLFATTIPVSGTFESNLKVGGTFAYPTFLAGITATGVEAYGLPLSSLYGTVRVQGRSLVLSDAGATFGGGEATLAGSVPLELAPFAIGPAEAPMSVDVNVVNLNPSMFDTMLGNATKLAGSINGRLALTGTVGAPVIVGDASLANGSYSSDLERTPITKITGQLSFNHTSATIQNVSASLGTGTAKGSGTVSFPHGFGSSSGLSFEINGVARNAQLDLPDYGSGTLDARMELSKSATSSRALLAGTATLNNATLPFIAFLNAAKQASNAKGGAPLPLAFDLTAKAGNNVRVRGSGYGAGLDIGATGSVRLGGTLASPVLLGTITSTGGTLTYFDRAFRVTQGSVVFDPAAGLVPNIHAVALTSVVNPDPDRVRNPYGSADITITVDGSITSPKVSFSSTPSGYTQDQIVALIAPFGGFLGGVPFRNQSAFTVQQPSGVTPLGQLSPIPNVTLVQGSNITIGQEAFNLLNAQFTAGILSPVENVVGQGLGLSSVNLTLGYYGNVGVSATRTLGKAVSAVFATTFGIPQTQSFGLQVRPGPYTSATLNFFYLSGPQKLFQTPQVAVVSNQGVLIGEPLQGNSGFSLTFQHYY